MTDSNSMPDAAALEAAETAANKAIENANHSMLAPGELSAGGRTVRPLSGADMFIMQRVQGAHKAGDREYDDCDLHCLCTFILAQSDVRDLWKRSRKPLKLQAAAVDFAARTPPEQYAPLAEHALEQYETQTGAAGGGVTDAGPEAEDAGEPEGN